MANVKIVLRKEFKKDGTSPLAIRVTKNRKSTYIYLEYSVKESDWDDTNQRVKKSHPNAIRLNHFLTKKKAEATDGALELEVTDKNISVQAVQEKVKATTGTSFFKLANEYLANLEKEGKFNRYNPDRTRINQFRTFLKDRDIEFSDITTRLIEKYKAYLKGDLELSSRSIANSLSIVRTIIGKAITNKIISSDVSPFGKNKVTVKIPESLKIGLTAQEVAKFEKLDLPDGSFMNHARNLWLFSFYFAGMRVSDVLRLRWSDFQNGRLFYTMGKNEKSDSLKVPLKAQQILNKYQHLKRTADDLVFPDLKKIEDLDNRFEVEKRLRNVISDLDRCLQHTIAPKLKIDKSLGMHIARHTFGNLAGDKISIYMLKKLYRHANITTTVNYQSNHIHKDADEALDAVIEF